MAIGPFDDFTAEGDPEGALVRASYAVGLIPGPDAPTVVNDVGAKQSRLDVRFDLVPADALFAVAHVLDYGANKYGVDNWKGLSIESILNHMIAHAYAYLSGDFSDDHLEHCATRALMALQLHLEDK